jgi:tRNA (adenine37-N6)-methyltransferase
MKEYYQIKPIGFVRSHYREASLTSHNQDLKLDEKILTETKSGKGSISEIIINKEYEDCLDGIEGFSHIMVLYWPHQVKDQDRKMMKVHPGGLKEFPLVGVFATRSPVRPNPICATTVELIERNKNILKVKSLDALDGTPIIDIKFHHPSYDSPSNVVWPDWMKKLIHYFREKTSQNK